MRCRLQEKSYDQLSIAIETALRAKFPHNRGWGVKVFPVIESKEGNRSQNILISNDGLYVSRAASFIGVLLRVNSQILNVMIVIVLIVILLN